MRLVVALALVALSSCLSEIGDSISSNLERCVSLSQTNLECARNMKVVRQRMYEKIEEIEELRETMDHIQQEMQAIHDTVTKIPYASQEIQAQMKYLKDDVSFIGGWLVAGAHDRVKAIDEKLSGWEDRVEESIERADIAITILENVNQKCSQRRQALTAVRSCVQSLADESVKSTIQQKVGVIGSAVNTKITALNERLAKGEQVCSSIVEHARVVVGNPISLQEKLNSLRDVVTSITRFFNKITAMENEEICSPVQVLPPQLRWLRELNEQQCYRIGQILRNPGSVPQELVSEALVKAHTVLKDHPSFDIFSALPSFNEVYNIDVNQDLPAELSLPTQTEVSQILGVLTGNCADQLKEACITRNPALISECHTSLGYESVNSLVSAVKALRGLQLSLNLDGDFSPAPSPVYQRELTTPLPPYSSESWVGEASETGFAESGETGFAQSGESGFYGDETGFAPSGENGFYGGETGFAQSGESGFYGSETGFYGGETEYYGVETGLYGESGLYEGEGYEQSILQTLAEIKELVRYLSEEQLNHFISGLKQILILMNRHEAQLVVDTLHHILLSELYGYSYGGVGYESYEPVYEATTPVWVEYNESGSTPVAPSAVESDFLAEQVRSLLEKMKRGPENKPSSPPSTPPTPPPNGDVPTSTNSTSSDEGNPIVPPASRPKDSAGALQRIKELIKQLKEILSP